MLFFTPFKKKNKKLVLYLWKVKWEQSCGGTRKIYDSYKLYNTLKLIKSLQSSFNKLWEKNKKEK